MDHLTQALRQDSRTPRSVGLAVAMLTAIQLVASPAFVRDAASKRLALALYVTVIDGVRVAASNSFAGNVRPEPLSRVVIEEAFGMGKADLRSGKLVVEMVVVKKIKREYRHIARIAGVFEHSLQRERGGLRRPIVSGMLHHRRIQAIDCNNDDDGRHSERPPQFRPLQAIKIIPPPVATRPMAWPGGRRGAAA